MSNDNYLGRLRLKPDPLDELLGMTGFGVTGGGCHRSASWGGVDVDCAEAAELFAEAPEVLLSPPVGLAGRLGVLRDNG